MFQSITEKALGAFRENLLQIEWANITKIADADDAYEKFLAIFKQTYHVHFPLKECKLNRKI